MTTRTARQRILLAGESGASGALGQALLEQLAGHDVIRLCERDGGAPRSLLRADGDIRSSLRGDVADHSLGLPAQTYDELSAWATVVIHLPRQTQPCGDDAERTTVDGARNLALFAEQADALLLHVSTAFVHPGAGSTDDVTALARAAFRAEGAARAASRRWTIVRPSVVIGDRASGAVPARREEPAPRRSPVGRRPATHAEPWWLLDVIPQDVAARALVALLDGRSVLETVWLTSGTRALTLETIDALCEQVAGTVPFPGAPHDVSDLASGVRPIAPPALAGLRPSAWAAITGLRDAVPVDMLRPDPLPTSVPELLGVDDDALPDVAAAYLRHLTRRVHDDERAPLAS